MPVLSTNVRTNLQAEWVKFHNSYFVAHTDMYFVLARTWKLPKTNLPIFFFFFLLLDVCSFYQHYGILGLGVSQNSHRWWVHQISALMGFYKCFM